MASAKIAGRKIEGLRVRKLNGKVVKSVLYNGKSVGHGKFFAASIDGELVVDENGKPRLFHDTGALERD